MVNTNESSLSPLKKLRIAHVWLTIVFLGTGIYQATQDLPYHVTVSFIEVSTHTVLTVHPYFDPPLRYLCAAFLLLAAFDHGVQAFLLFERIHGYKFSCFFGRAQQYELLGKGIQPNYARWIEYSFSASLMILLIALACRMVDFMQLSSLVFLRLAMLYQGYRVEVCTSKRVPVQDVKTNIQFQGSTPDYLALAWDYSIQGFFLFACTWYIILFNYFYNIDVSDSNLWFVHVIIATMFVMEISFGIISLKTIDSSEETREWCYCIASFVAKQTLSWLVYGGFKNGTQ